MHRYIRLLILILLVIFGNISCEKHDNLTYLDLDDTYYYQSEIFDSIYLNLYGNWNRYYGNYGRYFTKLLIKEIGIYGVEKDSTIVEFGHIKIVKLTNKSIVLRLIPSKNSFHFLGDSDWYFRVRGHDSLSMSSIINDGPYYYFDRDEP